MDDGKGRFIQLDTEGMGDKNIKEAMAKIQEENPKHGGWFRVDEIIEIRGSLFRVKSVKPTELRLKLLPK